MAGRQPPSVRARQLARELRDLRTHGGRTIDQVADGLGWSSAKVSRIETAYTLITVADLQRLLEFYGVADAEADRYVKLAKRARERGWWETYIDTLTERYAAYIGLEADAQAKYTHRVAVIEGLLQTEAYARETIKAWPEPTPPKEVERLVQIRLRRQSRLRSIEPLEVVALLDEGLLRRRIAAADVMRGQLRHLLELAILPNVTIRVISLERGSPLVMSDFSVLKFQEPEYPEVVHIEQMSGSLIVEDDSQVFRYTSAFERIREDSLSEADSLQLIERIADEY
jgi:transcriptional regulator with XRE-family HTH domain